jgi:NAD-dependent DNA ligase
VESGQVRTIADMYRMSADAWGKLHMGGRAVGKPTGVKIAANLAERKELALGELIGALGIPLCGRTVCNSIVDAGFDTLDALQRATVHQISVLPGMGQARAESFVEGLKARATLIQDILAAGVKIKVKTVGALTGKSFCFTGVRDKHLELAIQNAGGVIKSSVGKGLTYLVAKDPKSGSDKIKKAQALGVQILGLADAQAMI